MATHSNVLAWRIPWTEESGGLQSMGLERVGHDRLTLSLSAISACVSALECQLFRGWWYKIPVVVAHPVGWTLLLLLILKGPHSGVRDVSSSVSVPSDE